MASKNIGTLSIDLVAKMGGFVDGMSKAERAAYRSMRGIKKQTSAADKTMRALGKGAGIAAAGIASLAGIATTMVVSQASAAREVLNLSEALGISTEQLTAGAYAAKQYGVEQDKYGDIVKDVSDKVGDFLTTGAGPMADFFETVGKKIGVTADMFRDLNGADALQLYVSSLDKANLSQNEMVFFLEAIASDASLLLPLLRDGGAEMARYSEQASDLGLVLDKETAQGAKEFDEALALVHSSLFGNYELLNTLTPVMKDFTDVISDPETLEGMKTFVGGIGSMATGMVELLASVSSVTRFIAEEVAAQLNGAAADDIVRLEQQAEKIKKVLDAGFLSPSFSERIRFFGKDGVVEYWSDAELQAELEKINAAIAAYNMPPILQDGDSAAAAGALAGVEASLRLVDDAADSARKSLERLTGEITEEKFSPLKNVLRELEVAQSSSEFSFGFDDAAFGDSWGESSEGAAEFSQQIGNVGQAYYQMDSIARSVMSDLVLDFDNATDNMGDTLKKMLVGMAADAAANEIAVQFTSETSSGNSSSADTATSSWWGAIIVAIAALGNLRNKSEDEKWAQFTAEYRQGVQDTGTVLGRLNEESRSLNNLIEDMNTANIDVLDVNYAMLSTLVDIRTGITGVADGFAKTGFGDAGSAAFANINVNTTTMNDNLSLDVLHQSSRIFEGVDDALGGGFRDPISAALGDFWNGLQDEIAPLIYRTDREITDTGIEVFGSTLQSIIDGATLQAQAYADVKSEEKLFGINIGTNVDTITEGLDEIVLGQLTGVFTSAGLALENAASIFGVDFGERAGQLLIEGGRLSLKDLEGEELSAEIESFFSTTIDQWAGTLLGGTDVLNDFQKVGEGAFETMVRLSNETQSWMAAADQLGFTFSAIGIDAVYTTQNLVAAAGGFDVLSGNLNTFTSRFTSDAEQLTNVTDQLNNIFAELGEVVPESHEAFSDLVRGIDPVTESGAELLTSLLALSAPMDDYLTALKRQADEQQRLADLYDGKVVELLQLQGKETEALALSRQLELAAMDESLHAIQNQIWANQDAAAAMKEADAAMQALVSATDAEMKALVSATDAEIGKLSDVFTSFSDSLRAEYDAKAESLNAWLDTQLAHYERRADALSDSISELSELGSVIDSALGIVNGSLGTDAADYTYSAMGIDSLAASVAAGGALPSAGTLEQYTQGLSGAEEYFGNTRDFVFAQSAIARDLDLLKTEQGDKLSTEEKMLISINESSEQAQRNHDRMLARNEDRYALELAQAEEQYKFDVDALEQQQAYFQEQINLLRDIDTSMPGLEDAVNQMHLALEKEQEAARLGSAEQSEQMMVAMNALVTKTDDVADAVSDLVNELRGAA